jgi:hypothetical protein
MKVRRNQRRPSLLKRLLRPQYLVVALLLLVGVVYLVAPRRVHEIVSVDGLSRWAQGDAPPQYRIVWQEAEPVEIDSAGLTAGDSLIRPQYAENGTALYFTLRKADGDADIYRCRLNEDHRWEAPERVAVLNSEADDVGPVIRRDGKRLYLYSNRPGGYGGFDIYVCDRVEGAWSQPRNLGPSINTPANEYDPAVSADGCRLFFASNQSLAMQARTPQREQGDEWRTTARADTGLATFDLYMTQRESPDAPWGPAVALDEINDPDSNEASPCLSPSGAFVYFVSDRPVRKEEAPNFDIYRARVLDDRVTNMENLGSGVNTRANEMEPALSREGYTLFFSRNRLPIEGELAEGAQGEQYGLYCSRATEVFERVGWGQSKLASLLAFLAHNGWWVVAVLLTLAFLAALIWYLREVSLRRLPLPGFFLTALLLHVLLGISSFYMYFGDGIYKQIKKEYERVVATRMAEPDLHQSHEEGKEAYEKLADLRSIERQETDIARRVNEMPNMTVPTENPVPEIPTRFDRDLPEDRLVATPPEAESKMDDPTLDRRQRDLERIREKVELERVQAAQRTENELAKLDVNVPRQIERTQMEQAPDVIHRAADPAVQLEQEHVAAEQVVEKPMEADVQAQPDLERQRVEAKSADASAVPTEQLAEPVPGNPGVGQPEAADVAVPRQVAGNQVPGTPSRLRPRGVIGASAELALDDVPVLQAEEQPMGPVGGAAVQPANLGRATGQVGAVAADNPQVLTEDLGAPVPGSAGEGRPQGVSVAVDRQEAPSTGLASLPTLPRESSGGSRLQLARADVDLARTGVGQGMPQAASSLDVGSPTSLKRAASGPAGTPGAATVETRQLAGPAGSSPGRAEVTGEAVAVSRQQTPGQVGGVPGNLQRRGLPVGGAGPSATDVRLERTGEPAPAGLSVGPKAGNGGPLAKRGTAAASIVSDSPQQVATAALATPGGSGTGTGMAPAGVDVEVARQGAGAPKLAASSIEVTVGGSQFGLPGDAEQPGELAVAAASIPGPKSPGVVAQLARARRPGEGLAAAGPGTIATEQPVASGGEGGSGKGTAVAGIDVGVDRPDGQLANIDVKTRGEIGGPHNPRVDRLVVGSLDREAVDAPVSFSRHATRLARLPAKAPATMYAEDSVGLRAMFRRRQDESKEDLIEKFGLSKESLAAVARGLAWLAKHQHEDGHWSLQEVYNRVPGKHYPDAGQMRSDTAATGFALLPFLGDGQTHQEGQYQANVGKGIAWLVEHQKENGDLNVRPEGNSRMYAHAIATIALCEAYGISRDPALREPAQKAVAFICWAQDKNAGGWRYDPQQFPDTSVVGWQVMALKSAEMAGLSVPKETLERVPRWLDKVAGRGDRLGQYKYQPDRDCTPAMTAEALLCLQYLGARQDDRRLVAGVEHLVASHLPRPGDESSYYWYYATQVMYHIQGPYWPRWAEAMEETLLKTQHTEGHLSGTWDSKDRWEETGGRIYTTCLRLLMLEVPYRHLPLYQLMEPER